MRFVCQRPITAGRVYFFPLKQMSVEYFYISPPGAHMTSPRPTTHQNNTGANKALTRQPMVENQSSPLLPSPSAARQLQKGCRMLFQMLTPPPPPALCLLVTEQQSDGCDHIKPGIWPADYSENTLDGWRGSSPSRGVPLSSVVQKPPHYCLFKLYMEISHCTRGWWVGFLS